MVRTFESDHFGQIHADEQEILQFPEGLPGFETLREFTVLQYPEEPSLFFLQSLECAELCFLALPVHALRPDYELAIAREDLEILSIPAGAPPRDGENVRALAVLSLAAGQEPTANLRAPVVIHDGARRAVQAIRPDTRYSCREPLLTAECLCS
jgi:flagellar assembly factor FliW